MIATKLIINSDLQESIPYISEEYACYTCFEQFSLHPDGKVPWHWHPEVELTLVLEGKIRLLINNEEYFLEAGDGMFINSNVLHYKEPAYEGEICTLNHVFDPSIIAGQYHSVFAKQYVRPILECQGLDCYIFSQKEETHRTVLSKIQHVYEITDQKLPGYELKARNEFSDIWLFLYERMFDRIRKKKPGNTLKEERVKYMMLYIHKNYADKLSLEQIAKAANISKRECLRCFNEILHTTPFHYLMEYRVRKATQQLGDTSLSIAEIGYCCGFSSTSYFTRIFRELIGVTPSEYRKKKCMQLME